MIIIALSLIIATVLWLAGHWVLALIVLWLGSHRKK